MERRERLRPVSEVVPEDDDALRVRVGERAEKDPFTTLKTEVTAPIPRPRVRRARSANPGACRASEPRT
jgi:hypothetical protein